MSNVLLAPAASPTSMLATPGNFVGAMPLDPARVSSRSRRLLTAGGRCLGLALVACLLTRPLLHPGVQTQPFKRTDAPVSVEADISRRMTTSAPSGQNVEEQVLWAGLE